MSNTRQAGERRAGISEARLKAQRRQVEINGNDVLPLSMLYTFGQSAEAMAVRAELKQVISERLQMLAEGTCSPEKSRELFQRSNQLRIRLNELTD